MIKYSFSLVFSLDRTHANFRQSAADEFYMKDNWVMASQKNGYGKAKTSM